MLANMNLPFIKYIRDHLRVQTSDAPAESQVGVIPYALVEGQISYLLVTSRGTGKWIFPKGAVGPGVDPRDAALQEAREEAGISGTVDTQPLGRYSDWKTRDGLKVAIEVTLYPMLVEQQFDDWEESRHRHRHWVAFPELAELIANPAILDLAIRLRASVHAIGTHGPVA